MGEPSGCGPPRWQELRPSVGYGKVTARRRIVQAAPIDTEFSAVHRKLCDMDGRIGRQVMKPLRGNTGLNSAAFDKYLVISAGRH